MVDQSRNYYFTSESASEGHPDKICDKISDTIFDVYLSEDKDSRVAVGAPDHDLVVISGEVRSEAKISENDISSLQEM